MQMFAENNANVEMLGMQNYSCVSANFDVLFLLKYILV